MDLLTKDQRNLLKDRSSAIFYYLVMEADEEKEIPCELIKESHAYKFYQHFLTSPFALKRGKNGTSTVIYLNSNNKVSTEKVITDDDTILLEKANDLIISADCQYESDDADLKRIHTFLKLAIEYKTRVLTKYFGHANFPDLEHIYNLQGLICEKNGEFDKAKQCFLKCTEILMDYPFQDNTIILEIFSNVFKSISIPSIYEEDLQSTLKLCLKVLRNVQTSDPTEHIQKLNLFPLAVSILRMSNDCDSALELYKEAEIFAYSVRKLVKKNEYQSSQQLYQIAYLTCLLEKQSYSKIINYKMKIPSDSTTRKSNGWMFSEVMAESHYKLGNYQEAIASYVQALNHKCFEHNIIFCGTCNTSWIGLIICCIKTKNMKLMIRYLKPILNAKNEYKMFNLMLRKHVIQPKFQSFFHCVKTKTVLLMSCNNCGNCQECISVQSRRNSEQNLIHNKKWRMFKNSNMTCNYVRTAFLGNVSSTLNEKMIMIK